MNQRLYVKIGDDFGARAILDVSDLKQIEEEEVEFLFVLPGGDLLVQSKGVAGGWWICGQDPETLHKSNT